MIDLTQFWLDNPALAAKPRKEYAVYGIAYVALAAAASQVPNSFTTSDDSTFVMTGIMGTQTTSVTNAAYLNTPLLVNLIYSGKNRNVMNVKLEWASVVATMNQYSPLTFLPYPITIPPTTQFSAEMDNPSAAVPCNVFLSFQGIKVFN